MAGGMRTVLNQFSQPQCLVDSAVSGSAGESLFDGISYVSYNKDNKFTFLSLCGNLNVFTSLMIKHDAHIQVYHEGAAAALSLQLKRSHLFISAICR